MKPVSDGLFAFENPSATVRMTHERCTAEDLALPESWFRDAIFETPELVIGPCRAADLTDEDWYPWQTEFHTEVGPIDVLLLSSQGRLAIVETKLASNSELRRKVIAQVFDYLVHLADALATSMPPIPKRDGRPVADADDIREAVSQGDILIIIASDDIDSRVAKLSRVLLSEHLTKQWDLALVDLALYRPPKGSAGAFFIVPNIRHLIESETRQVVRVIVQGERPSARVEVERIDVDSAELGPKRWNEQRFFESLAAENAPAAVQELANALRGLALRFGEPVTLAWGRGSRMGSMVLKRNGSGLIEVYGSGEIRFRPSKFVAALGEDGGRIYQSALEAVLPSARNMHNPGLTPTEAAKIVPALITSIENALEQANSQGPV